MAIPDTQMVSKAIPSTSIRRCTGSTSARSAPGSRWAVVAPYEAPTRALVTRLIDGFESQGQCDFMADFASPFPGLAFFELVLGAPPDEAHEGGWPRPAGVGAHQPRQPGVLGGAERLDHRLRRRPAPPSRGDVVDAILAAEIEGRPIREDEVMGLVLLLILGGLETTAGALASSCCGSAASPPSPRCCGSSPSW